MQKQEISKEFLEDQYLRCGKNRYEISRETGVTPARIGSLLQKYGIRRYSVNRHGLVSHPLNSMWCGMKERCLNQNSDNYKWYGGRGISVCDKWMEFKPFYDWAIANGWEPGLTIDRINTDGDYSPENCRFITHKQQCRNRRTNNAITLDGETHIQCEWEEILHLPKKIIAKWKNRNGMEYVIDRLRKEIDKQCG